MPSDSEESELAGWAEQGVRRVGPHSGLVRDVSPIEVDSLAVAVEGPMPDYFTRFQTGATD